MSCIFCNIIEQKKKTKAIYEDDLILAIKDIKPLYKTHILVMPKKHIRDLYCLDSKDCLIMGHLIFHLSKIASTVDLMTGFNIKVNVGKSNGQVVEHLHFHLTSNT